MVKRKLQFARELRSGQTDAESVLWRLLRDRRLCGYKFRRQVPMDPYIFDFVCFGSKLIIEVDGGQHGERQNYDRRRDLWARNRGYRVLRFWNHEVLNKREEVLGAILSALEQVGG